MRDNRMKDALENIARRRVPENTNLWPNISAQLGERKSIMQTIRTRPLLMVIIIILALLLLTGVVYAVGTATGYIPGVGFVNPSAPIRVLAKPVSQTQAGITVTIEQVIVDSERTVVIYKTEGLTIQAANSKGEGGGNPFGSVQLLRLPDGSALQETPETGYGGTAEPLINNIHTEGGWPNYVARLVYPPVSSDVNELTLLIPVLQNMPVGAAAENWSLTFHLKPAPADMTFEPVIMLTPPSTPLSTNKPVAGATGEPALSDSATLNGFTFKLDNVVELQDGFVFTGNLSWDNSVFPTGKGYGPNAVIPTLTDASGQVIPMEEVQIDPHKPFSFYENNMPWSYRTDRKAFSGPLVLSIPSITTIMTAPDINLEINIGPNTQIGQGWEINRDFVVAGHTIHLLSVSLTNPPDTCSKSGLEFKFKGDVAGIGAMMTDVNPEPTVDQVCGGGGGGGGPLGPVDPTVFYGTVGYRNIPTGLHHYSISILVPYVVNGPWQVTWTPPLTSEPTPTPAAGACLTLDKWNQLSTRNSTLPSGLRGKILTTVDEGGLQPAIYISTIDGSGSTRMGTSTWPSFSTDGKRLAYSGTDGIHIHNLSSGENQAIGSDGYNIIWSPDNTQLMYTNTFNLFVVNIDGSGRRKIDTGSAQVISPAGWADNQTIVYAVMGGDGFTFTSYNLQSGETKKLFTIQNKAGFGAISPDGQWIVFADRIFGATNWGIFISRLDGSQRKLVADPEIPTAFSSVWGPDGQWLILNTQDMKGKQVSILVNPFTCQAIHLNTKGFVEGWSP